MVAGCCRHSAEMLLDAQGNPDPALIEAKVKRYPEHCTIEGQTEFAKELSQSCKCNCHRNIPGSYTMC